MAGGWGYGIGFGPKSCFIRLAGPHCHLYRPGRPDNAVSVVDA